MKIGLTGNIASGKSEVEKILIDYGYTVYDLDKVVHEIYQNKTVASQIYEIFSSTDRKIISDIVFKNKNKLKLLEDIIYPELRKFIENLAETQDLVFISGALIYEKGFDIYFDKIIYVDANKNIRLERLKKRNNLETEQALERINIQNTNYKNKADYIITNNSDFEQLKINVNSVLDKISK